MHEIEIAAAGRSERHAGRYEAERGKARVLPQCRDPRGETREQGHGLSDDEAARRLYFRCGNGDEAAGGSAGQDHVRRRIRPVRAREDICRRRFNGRRDSFGTLMSVPMSSQDA